MSEGAVKYVTEIDPLTRSEAAVPVEKWFLAELHDGGWVGFADVIRRKDSIGQL